MGSVRGTTLRKLLAVLGAAMIGVGLLSACEEPTEPMRYFEDPIASYRVNGVGYATIIVGNRVYLGGEFTQIRDQNGAFVANRSNVAAFSRVTGEFLPEFRADTNARVRALTATAGTLFIGGDFSNVNGTSRQRFAGVNPASGEVKADLVANIGGGAVWTMDHGGGKVFLAGTFSSVRGVSRTRAAAVDAHTGAVEAFDPAPNATVQTIAATKDGSRVFIGGRHTRVRGGSSTLLTALRGDTGALTAPTFTGVSGVALDLDVNHDDTRLAAALGDYGNQGAWFDLSTGTKLFRQICGGDAQAVAAVGETLFTGFHEECEDDFSQRLTANDVKTGVRDREFMPTFDRYWGVHAIAATTSRLAVAGDFTDVNGVRVQGLALFPVAPPPPPPPPPPVTLPLGSVWRYNDTGSVPANWNQPGFDDGAWPSGPAQLGYGDGDEATVIGYGPNPNNKHMVSWFRSEFEATARPGVLTLELVADDGAVVYLNGVEVLRDNMRPGPVTNTTSARSNRSGPAEHIVRSFLLPTHLVNVGTNTIAVSVHQDVPGSSDKSFDAGLSSSA